MGELLRRLRRKAEALDAVDELARFRARFYIPPDTVYMDGNSLGLLSVNAERSVLRVLDQWRTLAIDGWLDAQPPWFWAGEHLGELACPLLGAEPDEVVLTGSTTANLISLAAAFYRPNQSRYKIVVDELNFPSDLYALAGLAEMLGYEPQRAIVLVRSGDGLIIDEEDIIAAMGPDVALVVVAGALYRSGQLLDMGRLCQAASDRGIPIGFDLSHSIGAVPHFLDDWGADFAFFCTYKYLNGGPGSTAGLYVNRRHRHVWPALRGWWGSDKQRQFDMSLEYRPASSAGRFQIGTNNLLSLAAVAGSLELFAEAGIERVRKKSLQLTDLLMEGIDLMSDLGVAVGTPREHERRGGHVAVLCEHAAGVADRLKAHRVIPDYRPPNIVRLAPVALYNTFADVCTALEHLEDILAAREYERARPMREIT